MAETSTDLLEMILRECAGSAPQPWYPSAYAQETGVPRDALDASLDQLRLGGLIRLTDWVQGRGQGYVLTPRGAEVVDNPRLMSRLRANGVPAQAAAPPWAPAGRTDERPTPWDRGEAVRAALLNPSRPTVTLTLIFLNVLVFLYGLALAVQQQVRVEEYFAMNPADPKVGAIRDATGALTPFDVLGKGQWWRLLSYCFVHGGLLHIVLNMYFLYAVGPMVERMWGSLRFLALYLISGLAGGCAVLLAGSAAVGASGALCGILASMPVWVVLNRRHLPPALVSSWLRGILINVVLIVIISMMPRVSAAGHLGGGLAGLVTAVPLTWHRFGHGWQRWLGLVGVLAVPAVCVGLVEASIRPQREDLRAVLVYRPALGAALNQDQESRNLLRAFANLTVKERRKDRAKAAEAAGTAAKVEGQMKKVADLLSDAGPFESPAITEVVKGGRDYAGAGVQFYSAFQRALDANVPWTQEDEKTFQERRMGLTVSRQELITALRKAGWITTR